MELFGHGELKVDDFKGRVYLYFEPSNEKLEAIIPIEIAPTVVKKIESEANNEWLSNAKLKDIIFQTPNGTLKKDGIINVIAKKASLPSPELYPYISVRTAGLFGRTFSYITIELVIKTGYLEFEVQGLIGSLNKLVLKSNRIILKPFIISINRGLSKPPDFS